VEEQMADVPENLVSGPGVNSTPLSNMSSSQHSNQGDGPTNDEQRRAADHKRAARERQRQQLNLQRESILSQRTSNPSRRAALEAALTQVEAQIEALG
jgi:multidrug efflux pump subunit AcrA (membrane-fusion protein)